MDRPEVSVLVPCWNAAGSIERALVSILETRGVDLECIVVDDASTDTTTELIERLAARDARIIVARQPTNLGVSAARNRGLELVRGEWLTLLDADDRFLPGALATLLGAALRTTALAVVGQQVWSDGRRTWLSRVYDIPDIRSPGRKSLAANPGLLYHASPHAKLFHRSCFEGLTFEGRVLGDQPWTIRALLRAGDRIEVIGDTVYEWTRPARRGPSTITTRTRSSAQLGLEVVDMAGLALASVRVEAEGVLPDDEARRVVLAAYLERLLHSDLRGLILRALWRADRSAAALFVAIERFIQAAPAELLTNSDTLAVDILAPPLRHWYRVRTDARTAYWSMFGAAVRADDGVVARTRSPVTRLGLQLATPGMGIARQAIVTSLLTLGWIADSARGRLRTRGRG